MDNKTWKDDDGYTVEVVREDTGFTTLCVSFAGQSRAGSLHSSTAICPVSKKNSALLKNAGRNPDQYREVDGFVIRSTAAPVIQSAILQLQAEKNAAAERLAANVPGLVELRTAHAAAVRYGQQFQSMMDDESNDGATQPKPAHVSVDDLAKQYPVADAYLTAEAWSEASHDVKASAGKRAMSRIADGEGYQAVIAEMESQWSAHCTARVWD